MVEADRFPCTDLGNAERLVAWHGQDLRHVPAWGWLVWDGRHWQRSDKLARERAHATIRHIYRFVADETDETRRKELAKHAALSEASHRISAMLKEAEARREIRAEVADFDTDPWLLNASNGTVDLRSGQLREHRRCDHLARIIPVEFHPDATSSMWDDFVREATAGHDGLADFLRRAAGYTLTGLTGEDALFIPHGPGSSGKTTFVETLKAALGPYAGSMRIEVLTSSSSTSGGHNEDVAHLVGQRMVCAVEASEEERLREGQIKHLTGGDTIPASLKHRPRFDFRPQLKLWLATNEVPYIRPDDSGMWRRAHKLPFENTHPKSELKERLQEPEHLRAVLAWAVRGCLEWQRDGLNPPACVEDATKQLRVGMDGGFERFLDECCERRDGMWTPTHELRAAYTHWAEQHGVPEARRISDRRLATILRRRGSEPGLRRPRAMPGEDPIRGWWHVYLPTP